MKKKKERNTLRSRVSTRVASGGDVAIDVGFEEGMGGMKERDHFVTN
jgi:hypothetical protein